MKGKCSNGARNCKLPRVLNKRNFVARLNPDVLRWVFPSERSNSQTRVLMRRTDSEFQAPSPPIAQQSN